jgi:hypothetical protein
MYVWISGTNREEHNYEGIQKTFVLPQESIIWSKDLKR